MAYTKSNTTPGVYQNLEQRLDWIEDGISNAGTGNVVKATGVSVTDTAAVQAAVRSGDLLVGNFSIDGSLGYSGYCIELADGNCVNGVSRDLCTFTLANSINADVFRTKNYGTTTQLNITLRNFTIDGNIANQTTSGKGLALDAYPVMAENLLVKNCWGTGIYTKNTTGLPSSSDAVNSFVNVKSGENGVHGFQTDSSDGVYVNCVAYQNGQNSANSYSGFYLNANATQLVNCHSWGNQHKYAYDCMAETVFSNCQAEGGATAQVHVGASDVSYFGGLVYSVGVGDGLVGFLFDTSTTAVFIKTKITNCTNGSLKWTGAGTTTADSQIEAVVWQTSGSVVSTAASGNISGVRFLLRYSGGATLSLASGLVYAVAAVGALTTVDPHVHGQLWSNAGTITVSAG